MSVKSYGVTSEETTTSDTFKCRQIVRTIIDFGVTEKNKTTIIFLLALELENRELMQEITALIKRFEAGDFKKSTLITDIE